MLSPAEWSVVGLLLAALLGAVIGSFLNVVIWRVPRSQSVVRPSSHCPGCGSAIRPRDNVPVVSWLVLRRRCRSCGIFISARYPAIELLTSVVFVALALRIGLEPALPGFLYLGAVGIALAAIDIDVYRLPNVIVLPSYVVGAGLLLVAGVIEHDAAALLRAMVAAVTLFAFYFLLALVYPSGMGFGDVKLAGLLGMFLGWLGYPELVVGAFLGFLFGGVLGGALMLAGRATRKSRIPFGPFMLGGALVAILWGGAIGDLYLHSLGR